jgi:hypothetical protein
VVDVDVEVVGVLAAGVLVVVAVVSLDGLEEPPQPASTTNAASAASAVASLTAGVFVTVMSGSSSVGFTVLRRSLSGILPASADGMLRPRGGSLRSGPPR